MKRLISLLKAMMSGGIQIFNYRARTERSRRIMPIVLGTLIGLMMLFSASAMVVELKRDNAESAILSVYTLVTTVIILMEGIYKSGDLLFRPRDNDMLLAMPIKKTTIVFARVIKFYLFELLYCLIFLLPAIIAYAMNTAVEPSYYLVALTALLLLPIAPIAISCAVGAVVTAVSSKFRHKTFWQIVLSFVSLSFFSIMILMANTSPEIDGNQVTAISDRLSVFYYPASAFVKLALHFDILGYLIFVFVHLATLLILVVVISRFYFQIVSRLSTAQHAKSTRVKYVYRRHSQTVAMVKKEITKYFKTPVLLMNTAIGLVLFVIVVIVLCFNFDGIMDSLMESVEDFPLTIDEIVAFMPSITFMLVAFTSQLTFITATMISLEGKAFDSLKALPISGLKAIMTKVLTAMLLIVPVTALGSLILMLRFRFGILEGLLVLVAVVAISFVTELSGILIDLRYARFDAESDAVTVKQSAGVMVATFLGLGMVLFTISLTFALVLIAGQIVGLLIMDAIFIIVSGFLYFAVATRGAEKYRQLM